MLVIPVVLGFSFIVSKYFVRVFRELARLQNILGSPLISHFSETLNGDSTIRAFRKEEDFIKKNMEILNKKVTVSFWKEAVKGWYQIRIILICSMIFLFTGIFVVSQRISFRLYSKTQQIRSF